MCPPLGAAAGHRWPSPAWVCGAAGLPCREAFSGVSGPPAAGTVGSFRPSSPVLGQVCAQLPPRPDPLWDGDQEGTEGHTRGRPATALILPAALWLPLPRLPPRAGRKPSDLRSSSQHPPARPARAAFPSWASLSAAPTASSPGRSVSVLSALPLSDRRRCSTLRSGASVSDPAGQGWGPRTGISHRFFPGEAEDAVRR